MSDPARQSLADKAASTLKPDSEKSTTEHMGDKIKGKADHIASKVQPESQKSKTQEVGDALSGDAPSVDDREKDASLVEKAKKAVLGDRTTN